MYRSISMQSATSCWAEEPTVLSGCPRAMKVFSYFCLNLGHQDNVALKNKEEVFHQAEAADRNDQRRNQPPHGTQTP